MRFVAKLLQHWYLYLIPILILPMAVGYYGYKTTKIYESAALLYVQDTSQAAAIVSINPYASPAQNAASAMLELMQSETFAVTVAAVTDLANQYDLSTRFGQGLAYARLSGDIGIYPTAVGGNTLQIVADDKDPKIAQQIVAGLITVFADYFSTQRLALDKKTEQFLLKQIDGAKQQVQQDSDRVQQYLNAHPNLSPDSLDPTLAQLQQQLQQDEAAEQKLSQQLSTVQFDEAAALSGNSQLFTVLDQPQLPLSSTVHLKKLVVYPAVGLGIALALIILIVGLRTILDRRVYTTRDLRAIADALEMEVVPQLLSVPVLTGVERNDGQGGDDLLSGVLVPVLAVLPQQDDTALNQELRRAVGVLVDEDD